jgi:tyrosine aminotransferase
MCYFPDLDLRIMLPQIQWALKSDFIIVWYSFVEKTNKPERNWEVDLEHLESLIDEDTSAILVNNPSNPCGSNFTEAHLKDILAIAERNYLPVISDEIYGGMNWTSHPFTPLYSLPSSVPIVTVAGLAKRWLVPGWRVGWVVLHERGGLFKELRRGISNLSQTQLHPNTVFQQALPEILNTPKEFFDGVVEVLKTNARLISEKLEKAPGLKVIEPQGAMYTMVISLGGIADVGGLRI